MTATERHPLPAIAADVLNGLTSTPKRLPPKLFYDAVGSDLFEQITRLPEYYVTRTEYQIFKTHAHDIVSAAAPASMVELGAGTATKTRVLLAAARAIWRRLDYYPVDVSWSALDCARTSIEGSLPGIHVYPIVNDYMQSVGFLRHTSAPRMVLYIGSSIGNLEHQEAAGLLRRLRERLVPGDSLLLGTDLVKCPDTLVAAYDDRQGVTAAFNKNVLARINRELGGHFDLDLFRHVAEWNTEASRMEMYVESLQEQTVSIDLLRMSVHFDQGERIHTENSYKYTPESVCGLLSACGFLPEKTWFDDRRYFAVHLARV